MYLYRLSSVENVFAVITSVVIILSVLSDCTNPSRIMLGMIPLLEAWVLHLFPAYGYRLNFSFGVIRVYVLILVNNRSYTMTSAGLLNYQDIVAIFLMAPSLLMDKAKNLNHIFLYFILLQQQIVNDPEDDIPFRFVLKSICFLTFSLIGFSKSYVQDRYLLLLVDSC
jgi:hypothetical protein